MEGQGQYLPPHVQHLGGGFESQVGRAHYAGQGGQEEVAKVAADRVSRSGQVMVEQALHRPGGRRVGAQRQQAAAQLVGQVPRPAAALVVPGA